MSGYVDLHCHWVWEIDDGARSADEGVEMLRRLALAGFSHVVATPHMRPGMFENEGRGLKAAYLRCLERIQGEAGLPETSLGSEHFFDAQVIEGLRRGAGLPYREGAVSIDEVRMGGAVLVEFADLLPLSVIEQQLFALQAAGFIPVIAHPERYRATWKSSKEIARLVELGSVALLDISALVGKYGRRAAEAAEELLELGLYGAGCTDSHRPADVDTAALALTWIARRYDAAEVDFLMRIGPTALLHGLRPRAD